MKVHFLFLSVEKSAVNFICIQKARLNKSTIEMKILLWVNITQSNLK